MNIAKKGINLILSLGIATVMFGSQVLATTHDTGKNSGELNEDLGKAFGDGLLSSSINLGSIVVLVFQLLIAVAILWVVWNVLKAGLKITGAGAEADKRAEGIKAIINACIGLVVVLSSYGIANTVKTQIAGNKSEIRFDLPCSGWIDKAGGNNGQKDDNERTEGGHRNDDNQCIWSEDNETVLVEAVD